MSAPLLQARRACTARFKLRRAGPPAHHSTPQLEPSPPTIADAADAAAADAAAAAGSMHPALELELRQTLRMLHQELGRAAGGGGGGGGAAADDDNARAHARADLVTRVEKLDAAFVESTAAKQLARA